MIKLIALCALIVLGVVFFGGALFSWLYSKKVRREIDDYYNSIRSSDY